MSVHVRHAALVVAGVTAGALLLAGCTSDPAPAPSGSSSAAASSGSATPTPTVSPTGSASPTATSDPAAVALLAKALDLAQEQTSVHVAGTDASGTTLDIRTAASGDRTGSVGRDTQKVTFRQVGDVLYVLAAPEFWIQGGIEESARATLKGKWVAVRSGQGPYETFDSFSAFDALLSGLLTTEQSITLGDTAEIAGVQARAVVGQNGSVWVAVDSGLPVRIANDADQAQLDFADWGAPVEVLAPPAAQTIAFASLPRTNPTPSPSAS